MKILMSAASSAAATGIIRHLRTLGYHVIGMDADALASPLAMTECDEFIIAPPALSQDYPDFLLKLMPRFDLFIPFIDEELRVLSSGSVSYDVLKKTLICPAKTIELCTSKIRFQKFCERHNLPIAPQTDSLPAIFKPDHGRGGRGILILDDLELLKYARKQQGVIQTRLNGMEYTVDVLTDIDGKWLFGLPRKRLRTAGVSRIGEIDKNNHVLELARRCVSKIPFAYAINIQIMLDDDNNPHLIEINPRLAGSVMFSVAAGFDLLDLAIKVFFGQPASLPKTDSIKNLRTIRYWQERHYEQA